MVERVLHSVRRFLSGNIYSKRGMRHDLTKKRSGQVILANGFVT